MSNTNTPTSAAGSEPEGDAGSQPQEQHCILTPVRGREDWAKIVEGDQPLRRITVLDTETTGLDWRRHQIIEIAVARVLVDAAGRIASIERTGSSVIDPGHPLSPEISELTGLSDAMVSGKAINGEQLAAFLAASEAVVAFNAAFDRSFVDALLPDLPPMKWGCAMTDVPWRKMGFEPGPQGYLLMQSGKFAPRAHRAMDDVLALVELLDHACHRSSEGDRVMLFGTEAAPNQLVALRPSKSDWRFHRDTPLVELAGLALPLVRADKADDAILAHYAKSFKLARLRQPTGVRFEQAIAIARLAHNGCQ